MERVANPWNHRLLAEGGLTAWLMATLAVALSYCILGFIVSEFFAAYGLFPAPIWLPAGIAVVAAMVGQWRLFPAIFLGSFLANTILTPSPIPIAAAISLTNALGPVACALVLRRLRPKNGLFTTFAGVISFLLCTSVLNPIVSATGGAIATTIGAPSLDSFYSTWVGWWLSDAGGTLYLAPALILWLGVECAANDRTRANLRFDRNDVIVWLAVAIASLILFLTPPLRGSYIRSAFPFMLVVPLSWIALRMSLRSAYTLVTLVSIVATVGTVAGVGPFQGHVLANPLQLVGTLVVLLAMNVLTIVALVDERQNAQNASADKSRFLAITSHELRMSLDAIISASSLIAEEGSGASSEYANYVRLIRSSGEYLLSLINDLAELSTIDAGGLELREEPVSLGRIVNDVVDVIGVQAHTKSIALKIEMQQAILIRADARSLRQALLNLLSNAIKFTSEGGRVGISASAAEDGDIVIRVADTGIGIANEDLERVFHPFERAHGDRRRRIEGAGLGLSIARKLIALHGGTLILTSAAGEGTVATVTLPADRVLPSASPPPPLYAAPGPVS